MALSALPPWLHPANFQGAMEGGYSAGLGSARITQAADEAANRLRLGYAELGSRQRENEAQRQLHKESAADALKAQQQEFGIRQAEVGAQHAAEAGRYAESAKRADAAQALKEKRQNWLEDQARLPTGEKIHHAGDKFFTVNPDGTTKVIFDASKGKSGVTISEKLAAVDPQPAVPASHRELFGFRIPGTDVAAQPAIPGMGERTVRRPATPAELQSMGVNVPSTDQTAVATTNAAAALAPPVRNPVIYNGPVVSDQQVAAQGGKAAQALMAKQPVFMGNPNAQSQQAQIPNDHIQYLQSNPTPKVVSDFNTKYGQDAASEYLQTATPAPQ